MTPSAVNVVSLRAMQSNFCAYWKRVCHVEVASDEAQVRNPRPEMRIIIVVSSITSAEAMSENREARRRWFIGIA
jgi:hypothetical protein